MEIRLFHEGPISEISTVICDWIIKHGPDKAPLARILHFIISPGENHYIVKIHYENLDKLERIMNRTNKIAEISMAPRIYEIRKCSNFYFSLMDYVPVKTLMELMNSQIITSDMIEELFRNIKKMHQLLKSGHGDLGPNNIIYNTYMNKWFFIDLLDVKDDRLFYDDYGTMIYYFSQPIPATGQYQIFNEIFDILKDTGLDRYEELVYALDIFLINQRNRSKNNEFVYWKFMEKFSEDLKVIRDYTTIFFGELGN